MCGPLSRTYGGLLFSHCSCSLYFLYLYIFRRFESGCLVPDSSPKRSRAEKTGRESSADSLELYSFFNHDVVLVIMAQMEGMRRIERRRCRESNSPYGESLSMRLTAFSGAIALRACRRLFVIPLSRPLWRVQSEH